jgi:pepF/M3 family oligoendopeptidase
MVNNKIMDRWSLDALYTGYDSQEFKEDYKKAETLSKEIQKKASELSKSDEKQQLISILHLLEEYYLVITKLIYYVNLKQSVDTTDTESVAYYGRLSQIHSSTSKPNAQIDKFIAAADIDTYIKEDDFLSQYEFYLKEIKGRAKHQLSDDVEEVIARFNLTGGDAWGTQQQYMTSMLEVEYDNEITTLTGIRNLAFSEDQKVRKKAYEAELASYKKIEDSVAFSINNIKRQVTAEADLRGYESPLAMTLEKSRMSKSTLDALLGAMDANMPKFREYLKQKAKILGYDNGLPWYELFAPIGKASKTFTAEEAKTYLVNHFSKFSQDLADMVTTAFDDQWIDFYPRKGKVGGAFCENLPFIKESRILTNFGGTLGDVVTLAHELGHAYHGMHIEDHRPLNTDYTMPVAETASTFNENLIMNEALAEADSKEEKLFLIEGQLQNLNQIICDIYSRYLFEKSVFEESQEQFLFAEDLKKLMLKAQEESYGDGLNEEIRHPYMWICKSHYYSSGLSYYNFPYAFGGLFARGLYAKYKQEGSSFIPKYHKMLHATTVSTVEDAARICDIDLSSQKFWDDAFASCGELIDEFIELTK